MNSTLGTANGSDKKPRHWPQFFLSLGLPWTVQGS